MRKNLLFVALYALSFNLTGELPMDMSLKTPTTVYFFRTGEKTTSYNPTNPSAINQNNSWIVNPEAALSEKGKEQAKELGQRYKEIQFDVVISSDAKAALETASCALPDRKIDLVTSDWREVDLGSLEGKTDKEVMALYARHHPNKQPLPFDGNECLNESWEQISGEEPIIFEHYGDFKKRIIKNLQALDAQYPGKVVAVFTHYEPLRDAIMFSRGTDHFFSTQLGVAFLDRMKQNDQTFKSSPTEVVIGSVTRRTMIKADKAAALKLEIVDGKFYVDDAFKINLSK